MFKDKAGNFSPFKLILTIFVVILAVIFLGSSFVVIPAGHTGVALTFGKVEDVVLQEGLHFKVPFVQKIVVVDNRIVKLDVNTEAFSKDLQTITTVVAVNYHVGKENSQTLYKNVGAEGGHRQVHRCGAGQQPGGGEHASGRGPQREDERLRHLHQRA